MTSPKQHLYNLMELSVIALFVFGWIQMEKKVIQHFFIFAV